MKPAVSICIPAYEQPEFISRTIASVFNQTFQDFEVIVTDDSLSTSVLEAVRRWEDDPRLIYCRNSIRLGSPGNWNAAMDLARGDLVKFLHHDDWFANETSLSSFVTVMQDNPQVNFAFSAANACEDDGSLIYVHCPLPKQIDKLRSFPLGLQFGNIVGPPSSTIFRKHTNFKFDTKLMWVVDTEAYLQLLEDGSKFYFIPEPLVCVSSNGQHQVTAQVAKDPSLRIAEHLYLYAKYTPRRFWARINGLKFLASCLTGNDEVVLQKINQKRQNCVQTTEERYLLYFFNSINKLAKFSQKFKHLCLQVQKPKFSGNQSFAQSGEDMIIDFLIMWLGIDRVAYLDIGAHHPTWLSNTYRLYCKGYRGVLIEPDEDLCIALREKRPGDITLNLAVGESGSDTMDMYVMSSRTLNTLDAEQARTLESSGVERIVAVREVSRLGINEILAQQFAGSKPNVVSLDVEGMDLSILKAWDFSKFKPEIFCVETLTYTRDNTERKLTEITDFMENSGYMLYADTFVNSIFVCIDAWKNRPCYASKEGVESA